MSQPKPYTPTLHELHDRLGSMIDQIGQPDYSLRELVSGLREVRDAIFAASEKQEYHPNLDGPAEPVGLAMEGTHDKKGEATAPIRVMKIRVDEGGPALYLPESQKDAIWAYVEDWVGKIEIKFTTMTQAELDALPEFDGF